MAHGDLVECARHALASATSRGVVGLLKGHKHGSMCCYMPGGKRCLESCSSISGG
jgi:hypothetical protein